MELVQLLYIVLIAATIVLTVLLSFVFVYVILILRDVNQVVDTTKDTAEKINAFVMKPVLFTKDIVKYAKPLIVALEKKASTNNAKASSRKKKSSSKKSS